MADSPLIELFKQHWPELPPETVDRLVQYRDLVLEESKRQNLTRLLSEPDFFWGHFWDLKFFLPLIQEEEGLVMDLGSGLGVPGIPAAIVQPKQRWILSDSEKKKAVFLQETVNTLALSQVQVTSERGEIALKNLPEIRTIVSRAVGKVDKLFRLLEGCSTWNKLILFKGRSWDQEWEAFQKKSKNRSLRLAATPTRYSSSTDELSKVLIVLERF